MQRKKWYLCSVLIALLLSVAAAQQNSAQNDTAKIDAEKQSRPLSTANEGAVARQQKLLSDKVGSDAGGAAADQPSAQPSANLTSGERVPAPFVEDFPSEPGEEEVLRPRHALPVILSSDSPNHDRSVPREYVQDLPQDYVIGEEDVLTITIWKEHDLSGTVVVRPDGRITVPLVGEVSVVGMKPLQLQTQLEDRLKPFITVPKVSIAVNQINSRKVYLIGQVVKEGTFPINSSMTVLQVLAGAGGLRDFAKRKKIYILRKRGEEEIRFPFDYEAAIRGRNREENIRVEPGDTIVVP
jgi:polysaccharide export outer membrane protein